jgi:hypothetical protein
MVKFWRTEDVILLSQNTKLAIGVGIWEAGLTRLFGDDVEEIASVDDV